MWLNLKWGGGDLREVPDSEAITFMFTPGSNKTGFGNGDNNDEARISQEVAVETPHRQSVGRYSNLNSLSSKEQLGRATWTFLHTLAAQFPPKPTRRQERDVRTMIDILTRMYPCKDCADHFKIIVRDNPPQTKSADELQQWMCKVHNIVNKQLGKPVFNCRLVQARWTMLECGEDQTACALPGK
eukprot:jgi/Botrbrau1/979/Bobra.114_1s0020.1